jgi:hypothetical protein
MTTLTELENHDGFIERHIGPSAADIDAMLGVVGAQSLDELVTQTVPASILLEQDIPLPAPRAEHEALAELKALAQQNRLSKSFIGMGYADTLTPAVILRNVMENPGWYTAYTPYQAEIAQGRLEALLNYQQVIIDLCTATAFATGEPEVLKHRLMICVPRHLAGCRVIRHLALILVHERDDVGLRRLGRQRPHVNIEHPALGSPGDAVDHQGVSHHLQVVQGLAGFLQMAEDHTAVRR